MNIFTAPSIHIYMLLQLVFTNKEEYFAQNYDHIYNTKHKSKIFQYPLHKTKQLKRIYSLYGESFSTESQMLERGGFSKVLKVILIKMVFEQVCAF